MSAMPELAAGPSFCNDAPFFPDNLPFTDRITQSRKKDAYRAKSVIVARNNDVYHLGVCIGVYKTDYGYLKFSSFLDRDVLSAGVNNDKGTGQFVHFTYAGQVAAEFVQLPAEPGDFLLAEQGHVPGSLHLLYLVEALEP